MYVCMCVLEPMHMYNRGINFSYIMSHTCTVPGIKHTCDMNPPAVTPLYIPNINFIQKINLQMDLSQIYLPSVKKFNFCSIKMNWIICNFISLSDHSDHSHTFLHRSRLTSAVTRPPSMIISFMITSLHERKTIYLNGTR